MCFRVVVVVVKGNTVWNFKLDYIFRACDSGFGDMTMCGPSRLFTARVFTCVYYNVARRKPMVL